MWPFIMTSFGHTVYTSSAYTCETIRIEGLCITEHLSYLHSVFHTTQYNI